ncbi:MAG: protein kinase, partial [Deltaproteobacteria bacterium]|nr:protein kinase [Deltaproteobacteria bacterium]
METDPTEMSISGEKHPSLAELRDASHPHVAQHLTSCSMCRSVVQADVEHGDHSVPITLDLPKGLVNESAFRWPVDPVARGGMAAIFAADDKRLGRTVMLKAPREGDDLPPGMADLFQRRVTAEARILAKLQHPSIVTIYELGKTTVGWPFCVLEKVEGSSLRERLDLLAEQEGKGPLRMRERVELLSNLVAIAEALAYAHERKVVHRDVTPNNILLGKRGEATLIDWGIARDLDAPGGGAADALAVNDEDPSMSGRMVTISAGTPPYLPLEQTQGRSADPSFDVYSFGVTLYEVVSGRTPFDWKVLTVASDRNRQLARFLDWLKSEEPVVPAMPKDRELSGIIARAMARNPAERFSADELVRALKQYLTGDLVFSHRYSLTGRLARWTRRNRAATVTIISAIGFAIGGVLVYGALQQSKRKEAEAEIAQQKAEGEKKDAETAAAAATALALRKEKEAEEAAKEAEEAIAAAEKAKKKGIVDERLARAAVEARKKADEKSKEAERAAKEAKGTAEEAIKRYEAAMKAKEEALSARDSAVAAREEAERIRDGARTAQANAEK